MNSTQTHTPGKPLGLVYPALLGAGLALACALVLRAAEPAVGVQGTVVSYDHIEDPSQLLERSRFEVVVDRDRYAINVTDENLTDWVVSDGRVSYMINDFALHLRHVPNPAASPLLAKVWYGPQVLTFRPFAGVLWLALTPYPSRIQQEAGPAPPWPAFWMFALNESFAHALRWTNVAFLAGPTDRRLVQSLDWIWSASALDTLVARNRKTTLHYWHVDPQQTKIKEAKRTLIRDGLDGTVAARYRVLQTTNYGGVEWPLEFRFETLSEGKVTMTWLGQVHALGLAQPVVIPPSVSRALSVDDHRFTDEAVRLSNIKYYLTNSPWPGTNDPALRQLFEAERARALLAQPRLGPGGRLAFAIAVILLTALSFPVLVLKWGRPGNKANHSENNQHIQR